MKSTTFFRSSGLSLSQHLYVVVLIIFFICSATSCKKEQDLTDSTSDRSTIESEQIDKSAAQSMVDSDCRAY
jgi:hypothetical protein